MIVLLESVHLEAVAVLESVDTVRLTATPDRVDDDIERAEVRAILTRGRGRITADTFIEFPNLVAVARCGAGLDNIDTAAAAAAGVVVVHAPGSTTAAVAETALLLMLAAARDLVRLDTAVKAGDWRTRDSYQGTELRGKRLGVVGLGAVGTRVAELGTALGMDVVGWNRSGHDSIHVLPLDELLATADVIQLCIALTPDTESMLGATEFAAMRPGTIVVNTARGGLVDHSALASALERGHLGGYAADVWTPEPPPSDDRLLATGRATVTPHVAAMADVTYREICVRPANSIAAMLGGGVPEPSTVYRGHG